MEPVAGRWSQQARLRSLQTPLGGGPVGTPCSISNANQAAYKSAGVKSVNTQARTLLTEANPNTGNLYAGSNNGSPSLY